MPETTNSTCTCGHLLMGHFQDWFTHEFGPCKKRNCRCVKFQLYQELRPLAVNVAMEAL